MFKFLKFVFFLPPLILVIILTIQMIFYFLFPNSISLVNIIFSALFFISFVLLSFLAALHFFKNHTQIAPFTLNAKIIFSNGVFKLSRNPMYLSLVLFLISFGSIFCPLALIITIPILMLSLLPEIHREEKFMLNRFGSEYQNYCNKVGRWL